MKANMLSGARKGSLALASIEMYVPLKSSPHLVCASLLRVVPAVAQGKPPYERLAMSVTLRDLRIGTTGEIQIPIRTRVQREEESWCCSLDIQAADKERFFPKFRGRLTVVPVDAQCELWLEGVYEVPLGSVGALLDATVLRGAAKNSLWKFLQWLADEIKTDARLGALHYEPERAGGESPAG